jgi:hypothetical protein
MKRLAIILFAIMLSSCGSMRPNPVFRSPTLLNNPSFQIQKGAYTYYDHSWGGRCPWMPILPMKRTAYNRQAYGGHHE